MSISEASEFGPFYEHVKTADGAQRMSIRPCIYTSVDSATVDDAHLKEVFWPIYSKKTRGDYSSWRFLFWLGADANRDDSNSAERLWLFPLWFSGRSSAGEEYAALFPLYGTVHDIFFDRISFVLFPLWLSYDKGSRHTRSVLWPIISRTEGRGIEAFRVFPFWGHSFRDGHYDASFILWPIWNRVEFYGDNPGHSWVFFPIMGSLDTKNEKRRLFLPPFFSFAYGKGEMSFYRNLNFPWPLFCIKDDFYGSERRFLPFYSRRTNRDGNLKVSWYAWPFCRTRAAKHGNLSEESLSVFPLYFSSTAREDSDGDGKCESIIEDYTKVWPIFSIRSSEEDLYFKFPDLSFGKRVGAIDRNLLGMFTLFTYGHNEIRYDWSFLWGAYAYGRGANGDGRLNVFPFYSSFSEDEKSGWSVLCGLLGRERRGDSSYLKWLWFFGGAPNVSEDTE